MNQDEIIAMATEAGLNSYRIAPGDAVAVWGRFAALVAAKEQEACLEIADMEAGLSAHRIAQRIRARGTKEGV